MKQIATILAIFAVTALSAHAEETAAKTEAAPAAEAAKPAAKSKKKAKASAKKDEAKKDEKATAAAARADGLKIEDLKVGKGKEAKLGSKITVHYRGTFKDGSEFDSSYKGGEPVTFDLLEGRLIKGWTEGIPGMKVGGKRKLFVPSDLAYGKRGAGPIKPDTDLNFEVELIEVQ